VGGLQVNGEKRADAVSQVGQKERQKIRELSVKKIFWLNFIFPKAYLHRLLTVATSLRSFG
jgi:hypothetical protein